MTVYSSDRVYELERRVVELEWKLSMTTEMRVPGRGDHPDVYICRNRRGHWAVDCVGTRTYPDLDQALRHAMLRSSGKEDGE